MKATYDQIKKCHVLITKLSEHTGLTKDKLKKDIKSQCGMSYMKNSTSPEVKYISLRDATAEDAHNFIEEAIKYGKGVGIELT